MITEVQLMFSRKNETDWHQFFALWPRVVERNEDGSVKIAWLCVLERRVIGHYGGDALRIWEVRAKGSDKSAIQYGRS